MAKLVWGEGPPMYELGLDKGVLYLDDYAVPWNGLVSVNERDTGVVNTDFYFDGNRLAVIHEAGDFEAEISAYTYPDIFAEYNGFSEHDDYKRFGLSYRTQNEGGNRLHLVYNVLVRDTTRAWKTVSDSVDPSLFNWSIYATAQNMPLARPAAHLILEKPANSAYWDDIEAILYGSDTTDARLPDPWELADIYEAATRMSIVYNGDGTYTASGPDEWVQDLGEGRFKIDAPSVSFLSDDRFVVHSY